MCNGNKESTSILLFLNMTQAAKNELLSTSRHPWELAAPAPVQIQKSEILFATAAVTQDPQRPQRGLRPFLSHNAVIVQRQTNRFMRKSGHFWQWMPIVSSLTPLDWMLPGNSPSFSKILLLELHQINADLKCFEGPLYFHIYLSNITYKSMMDSLNM